MGSSMSNEDTPPKAEQQVPVEPDDDEPDEW